MRHFEVAGVAAAIYRDLATPANDPFRDDRPWAEASTQLISVDLSEAAARFEKAKISNETAHRGPYYGRKGS